MKFITIQRNIEQQDMSGFQEPQVSNLSVVGGGDMRVGTSAVLLRAEMALCALTLLLIAYKYFI